MHGEWLCVLDKTGRSYRKHDGTRELGFLENLTDRLNWHKLLFEFTRTLGNYCLVYFYGLFWGEQQPFVSSGCGGLYFFGEMHRRSYLVPLVFLLVVLILAYHRQTDRRPDDLLAGAIGRFRL